MISEKKSLFFWNISLKKFKKSKKKKDCLIDFRQSFFLGCYLTCYFLASSKSSNIFVADSDMIEPGPKIAAAPAL